MNKNSGILYDALTNTHVLWQVCHDIHNNVAKIMLCTISNPTP